MRYYIHQKNALKCHCNAGQGKYRQYTDGSWEPTSSAPFETTDINIAHEYKRVLEQEYTDGGPYTVVEVGQ